MRFGVTPETMAVLSESMSQNAPYEVLQQDETAHIVASKAEETTGYVIFKANTTLNDNTITSTSQSCVITTQRHGTEMVFSVADPDLNFIDNDKAPNQWGYSQPSTIVVTLRGRWKIDGDSAAAIADPKTGETAITVICTDGLTSSVKLIPNSN
jgi:chondroitin-sulfate-ABC endolyase/exolyase